MTELNEEKLFNEELSEIPEEPGDDFDWEAVARTSNNLAGEARGVAKRNHKDLSKVNEEFGSYKETNPSKTTDSPAQPTKDESAMQKALENSETALLIAHGLKTTEERDLFQKAKKSTGAEIDEVLADEFFQNKLKGLREENASEGAIPTGSKSSSSSPKGSVDHWIAKGELPPDDGTKEAYDLRKAVVKKKTEIAGSAHQFRQ